MSMISTTGPAGSSCMRRITACPSSSPSLFGGSAEMRMLISAGNREVAVEHGRIVETVGPFDVTLSFPQGEGRPGLINAHDHLHRNHYGRLGRPPYRSAPDWAPHIP